MQPISIGLDWNIHLGSIRVTKSVEIWRSGDQGPKAAIRTDTSSALIFQAALIDRSCQRTQQLLGMLLFWRQMMRFRVCKWTHSFRTLRWITKQKTTFEGTEKTGQKNLKRYVENFPEQWVSQTDVPKSIHTRPESDKTSSILLKRGHFYLVAPSVKTFWFAL